MITPESVLWLRWKGYFRFFFNFFYLSVTQCITHFSSKSCSNPLQNSSICWTNLCGAWTWNEFSVRIPLVTMPSRKPASDEMNFSLCFRSLWLSSLCFRSVFASSMINIKWNLMFNACSFKKENHPCINKCQEIVWFVSQNSSYSIRMWVTDGRIELIVVVLVWHEPVVFALQTAFRNDRMFALPFLDFVQTCSIGVNRLMLRDCSGSSRLS